MSKKQKEIINQIHDFVKEKSANFAEDDVFNNHILGVRNFAVHLAKKYNANIFVVTASAYLHDIYRIMHHKRDNHEVEGSKFSKHYLKQFNLPKEEIKLIAKCILNHRGSKKRKRNTIEEKIIACADAMDHINRFSHMFYRVSKVKDYSEAVEWISKKMKRSWKKIELKEGRNLIRKKYNAAKTAFEF